MATDKKFFGNKVLTLMVMGMVLLSFLFAGCKSTEDKWKDALKDFRLSYGDFNGVQYENAKSSFDLDWTTDSGNPARIENAKIFYEKKYYAQFVEKNLQVLEKIAKDSDDKKKQEEVKHYRGEFENKKNESLAAIKPRKVLFGKLGEYYTCFVLEADRNWDKPISNPQIAKWAENKAKMKAEQKKAVNTAINESEIQKQCKKENRAFTEAEKVKINALVKKVKDEIASKYEKTDINKILRDLANVGPEKKSEAYNASFGKPASEGDATNEKKDEAKKETASATANTNDKPAVITGTEVRFRKAPDGKIMGYFDKGETVTILGKVDNWYNVRRKDGSVGFVSADFCKAK